MYFKKMIGEKCFLSPISEADAEQYTAWLNDAETARNLQLYGGSISLEAERGMIAELAKGHNYAIVGTETERLLGNCGFMDIDPLNATAEAGIFIGDAGFRNRGYGTEALHLLLDYGFRALNLHSVILRVYSFNAAAKRCYEKAGFREIGRRRQALRRDLAWHDIIYMDILADDFYGKNTGA